MLRHLRFPWSGGRSRKKFGSLHMSHHNLHWWVWSRHIQHTRSHSTGLRSHHRCVHQSMNSKCHPCRLEGGCKFVSLHNLYLFCRWSPTPLEPVLSKERNSDKGAWIRCLQSWIFALRHRSTSRCHHCVGLPNVLILGKRAHLHNRVQKLTDLISFQSIHLRTHMNLDNVHPFCNSPRWLWSLTWKIQLLIRLCWGCLPSRQSVPSFIMLLR